MGTRTIKPTVRAINALAACPADSKSKGVEYSFLGHPGLKLLVSKTGDRTFYHRFVFDEGKRAQRLGRYPDYSLEEAIQKVRENRAVLDRGGDPQEAPRAQKAMPTFEHFVINDYLPFAFKTKRSAKADESKVRIHMLEYFKGKRLDDISVREVQAYHIAISQKLSPSSGNRHLMLLSVIFSTARSWLVIPETCNPTAGVKQFKEPLKHLPQLKQADIAPLFKAMAEDPNQLAVSCIKVMLLTGARRSEAQGMLWSALDLAAGIWTIEKTKSGKTHVVQLNDAVLAVLAAVPRTTSSFVFPGHVDKNKPLHNPCKAFDRCLTKAGLPHMRLHSLRHSFCSFAVAAGASLYSVQGLVGHAHVGTTTRYAAYDNQALRRATQLVSSVVSGAVSGTSAA
ncbi:hypothetical protein [Polaromonas sp. CG9_12]|nr:hypothetical protein [Polaromonas sp. CG9_12]